MINQARIVNVFNYRKGRRINFATQMLIKQTTHYFTHSNRAYTSSVSQAGGCAGMCVDLALFPLDTMKTRLQSQQGFYKAGGFRGIYAGVPSAAIGSFPNGTTHVMSTGIFNF